MAATIMSVKNPIMTQEHIKVCIIVTILSNMFMVATMQIVMVQQDLIIN